MLTEIQVTTGRLNFLIREIHRDPESRLVFKWPIVVLGDEGKISFEMCYLSFSDPEDDTPKPD